MRPNYLTRAELLLVELSAEKIMTPEGSDFPIDCTKRKLNSLRASTHRIASLSALPGPGLTSCVAVSLLKVGACQELAQRFALDYFLKFKEKEISLIFLGKSSEEDLGNHVFVLVGPAMIPDGLIMGRGAAEVVHAEAEHRLSLQEFLKMQPAPCVVADPLLGFSELATGSCDRLYAYCRDHAITQVFGVRSYAATPGIVEIASELKANAWKVAEQANREEVLIYLHTIVASCFPSLSLEWKFNSKQNCFCIKADEATLIALQSIFAENKFSVGSPGELDIVKGVLSGAPILVLKNASQLDLNRLIQFKAAAPPLACGLAAPKASL